MSTTSGLTTPDPVGERCYKCGCILGDGFEGDYCMTWQQAIELHEKNQVLLLWLLAEAEWLLRGVKELVVRDIRAAVSSLQEVLVSLPASEALCTRCGEPVRLDGHDCRPWKGEDHVEVVDLDPHELLRRARSRREAGPMTTTPDPLGEPVSGGHDVPLRDEEQREAMTTIPDPVGDKNGARERVYPVHRIQWTLRHGWIAGNVTCSAPEGAPCREHCPEGCPEWPCGHDLIDGGECTALPWLEDNLEDLYAGPDHRPVDGPIELEWCDGSYSWFYASEPDLDSGSLPASVAT